MQKKYKKIAHRETGFIALVSQLKKPGACTIKPFTGVIYGFV
jgi:hypothetical protein